MRRRWVTLAGALAAVLLLGSVGLSVYSFSLPAAERPYVAVGALFALGSLLAAVWLLSSAVRWVLRAAALRSLAAAPPETRAPASGPGGPLRDTRYCLECGMPFQWRADHPRNQLCHACRVHERLVEMGGVLEAKR